MADKYLEKRAGNPQNKIEVRSSDEEAID